MRIAYIQVENFRGIKSLQWAPAPGLNCLIGAGDSTKTTILDAIELALNPRSYLFADDSDFFNLDIKSPIIITVTVTDLPADFIADDRYGMHLRGWNKTKLELEDESGEGLTDALSVRVMIDESLEARWQIFNERIEANETDPPTLRYKDAQAVTTTRLGPYAERHLGWGRHSVLTRIGEGSENVNLQLAEANRAAREAFRQGGSGAFKGTVERAQELSKDFAVPVREKYTAELDVQGVNITSGGIALHDGGLPLRRLGTGSSRLIVSALQHDAGGNHIGLIDEVEHGLEPHRIARLLQFVKPPVEEENGVPAPQIFMSTHSSVVIRELKAEDLFAVRSHDGTTDVLSVSGTANDINTAQRHLRHSPEAFLAPRVIVGEGRTEQGLLRGLDAYWSDNGQDSFALCGCVVIDGGGTPNAEAMAEHLIDLGYQVCALLDSDEAPDQACIDRVKAKHGTVTLWPGNCSTEERMFLDVPWQTVRELVTLAVELKGEDSVLATINNRCSEQDINQIADLTLPEAIDNEAFRRAIGQTAKNKSWYKSITNGERLALIVGPCLDQVQDKPFAQTISILRQWVDG